MKPGLFAQDHGNSSRDYTRSYYWGKNQFNSSFPASLVAYMSSLNISPVYIKTNKNNHVIHDHITASDLFRIDPLAANAFYMFEAGFPAYDRFYTGDREKIDLVMYDSSNDKPLIGLEVKLTAIPDITTKNKPEDKYGCEIVVRPPTINFIACSICHAFSSNAGKAKLKKFAWRHSHQPLGRNQRSTSQVQPDSRSYNEGFLIPDRPTDTTDTQCSLENYR